MDFCDYSISPHIGTYLNTKLFIIRLDVFRCVHFLERQFRVLMHIPADIHHFRKKFIYLLKKLILPFIALAAVIFGRWNPLGAFFAALLFGFTTNMQYVLAILGTPVPSQFMAMLPYLVTVLVVAGLVGRSRGPAAAGSPYVKE